MSRKLSQSRYRRASPQRLARAPSRGDTQGTKSPIAWFVEIVSLVTAIGTILSVLLFNSLLSDGSLQYIQFASLSDMLRDGLALTIVSLAPFVMVSPLAVALVLMGTNALIYDVSAKGVRDKGLMALSIGVFGAAFLAMGFVDQFLDMFGFGWRIVAPLWSLVLMSGVVFGLSAIVSLIAIRKSVPNQRERSVLILRAFLESRMMLLVLLALFVISVIIMAGHLTKGGLSSRRLDVIAGTNSTSEVQLACRNAQGSDARISLSEAILVWSGERAIVVRCSFHNRAASGVHHWDEQVVVLNPGRIEV